MKERIQKVLAAAGVASRRRIEELIREGRVTVNGEPAGIGQKIGREDRIKVDGRGIALPKGAEPVRVLAYKKRVGEVVTRADPDGRRTVFRKLPELEAGRWIAIGRLDINTSGLLLLTNNGELARRLMHPSYEVEREYAVRVLGDVDDGVLERCERGVKLDDGPARFQKVWRITGGFEDEHDENKANRWFGVVVKEGRNRLVRRVWEALGYQVSRLIRVRYGAAELGRGTKSGAARELSPSEVAALLRSVGMNAGSAPAP